MCSFIVCGTALSCGSRHLEVCLAESSKLICSSMLCSLLSVLAPVELLLLWRVLPSMECYLSKHVIEHPWCQKPKRIFTDVLLQSALLCNFVSSFVYSYYK